MTARINGILGLYDKKRVLVCGASGMTGRNLAEKLVTLGADVTSTYLNTGISGYQIDFSDKTATSRFFNAMCEKKTFDYVFICCANTYNAFVCKDNPESMILSNVNMVGNILHNCLKHKVGKVLYISSSVVYQPSNHALSETELDWNQNPHDIYMGVGWMKRYAEKLCEFYWQQGLEVLTVRPTNIYGKYDKTDEKVCHVIPALIKRALAKEDPFNLYGTGQAVKNFIYVDDIVRDILILTSSYSNVQPVNLCSDETITILDLAKMICDKVGHHPECGILDVQDSVPYRNLKREVFDRLYGKLLYTPLTKGIDRTIQWYSSLHPTPSV